MRLLLGQTLALTLALPLAGAMPAAAAPDRTSYVAAAPTTRVLAISVDGLNPSAIRRLGRSGAPNFYRLMDEGASTLNARTMVEQTVTLPNHASMMTGRRIDRAKAGHGVIWDDHRPKATVQSAAGHPVRSVFDVVGGDGRTTALFANKVRFGLYQRSWPDTISAFKVDDKAARLTRTARKDLVNEDRGLVFLHLALPDRAGHEHGFMSADYVDAVQDTDALIGKLLRSVDKHADLAAELIVVLTADHGGVGPGHSQRNRKGNYRIPFLVWGAGVSHGNLYAMNPTYRDPGGDLPGYGGRQPVRNGDLANLVTDLLGLGPVPGSRFDHDQSLTVAAAP